MKKVQDYFRKGAATPIVLAASAMFALLAITGAMTTPLSAIPQVDIRTEPQSGIIATGDTFEIQLIVESSIAVNAFEGELLFDSTVLTVQGINYNTSIADLWVQEPWYSNGDGSINFAGGTTKKGGFTGTDTLLTITFKSIAQGAGHIGIKNARIMQHDGLGTDALVHKSIDAIFTVEDNAYDILRTQNTRSTSIAVVPQKLSTDLNNDGKQNLVDVSIFMLHLTQKNPRSDFNGDGRTNTADLSIILDSN